MKLPAGCDQQGRHPEAAEPPAPAEAATDLGLDEPPEYNPLRIIVIDAVIAALVVIVIAVIGWRVAG